MRNPHSNDPAPTRRTLLGAGTALAAGGLLTACGGGDGRTQHADRSAQPVHDDGGFVAPDGPEVRAAEAKRAGRAAETVEKVRLTAARDRVDLGGTTVDTWTYGGELPGREVRLTAGSTLALTLANHLPEPTSLHWHGLALRNDMDGVPRLTQPAVRAGAAFTYRFTVPHPGTYWFHPHTGVQQDRGLYAPLIVEDPDEPLSYDREWTVVLDDWLDGVDGSTPEAVLEELGDGMDHSGGRGGHTMSGSGDGGAPPSRAAMGAESKLLGGDAGDVAHPHHLLNGRLPDAPSTMRARPGERIRIRLVNAGGDTAFRVALGGHTMTVTHTDGFPVRHRRAESLLLGMGERYDVLVTAGDGAFPLTALAEGKGRSALGVLRTGGGARPSAKARPAELAKRPVTAEGLRAADEAALPSKAPDRRLTLRLTGSMAQYDWSLNGETYDPERRYPLRAGERVRLSFVNATHMWHPMHLHGHTFALTGGGPRKDTAIVLPGRRLDVDFDADNPGLWMAHCHNVYHGEAGMMTVLGYRK
ncbi:multicopper oxidase family protein [Streptomyces xiaopingdaonensis]|uniref:multicopper oxidase family protein n=1 Tax=Streptomyces xiaopingdaonensis TaxID=1565415 RepID=UPI0002F4DC2C|nr:multicopper oxidase family protein [Streptomyces xiaopingdaonensis]